MLGVSRPPAGPPGSLPGPCNLACFCSQSTKAQRNSRQKTLHPALQPSQDTLKWRKESDVDTGEPTRARPAICMCRGCQLPACLSRSPPGLPGQLLEPSTTACRPTSAAPRPPLLARPAARQFSSCSARSPTSSARPANPPTHAHGHSFSPPPPCSAHRLSVPREGPVQQVVPRGCVGVGRGAVCGEFGVGVGGCSWGRVRRGGALRCVWGV